MQIYQKLNNGNSVPVLGLGTWESEKNLVGTAVKFAIVQSGYRHIDCASIYGNEREIGEALTDILTTSVKRELKKHVKRPCQTYALSILIYI